LRGKKKSPLPRYSSRTQRCSSRVWAQVTQPSNDARFVAPGAVSWLLLHVVGREAGPTGGGKLLRTSDIQRRNTEGGVAPPTGCSTSKDDEEVKPRVSGDQQ
jgi:hypothetical protein